jgi:predicted Zn-dependent peptidase
MAIVFSCGSYDERIEGSGVAHFLEHVITGSCDSRSVKRKLKYFSRINGTTGAGYTYYTMSCNKDVIGETYSDMVNSISSPDYSKMDIERPVILSETWKSMLPDVVRRKYRYEKAFGHIFHDILGSYGIIESAGPDMLNEYHLTNYTLDNVHILSIGGLERQDVLAICNRNPLRLPKGRGDGPSLRRLEHVPDFGECNQLCDPSLKLASISIAFMTNAIDNLLVGVSFRMIESILHKRLRVVEGLVYSVTGGWVSYPDYQEIEFFLNGVQHEDVNKVLSIVNDCFERARTDLDTLEAVKLSRLRHYLYGNYSDEELFSSAIDKIVKEGCVFEDKEEIYREMGLSIGDVGDFMEMYSLRKAFLSIYLDKEESLMIDCL